MRAQQVQPDELSAVTQGRDSLGASRTPTPAPEILQGGRKSTEPPAPENEGGVKRQKVEEAAEEGDADAEV